MELTYKIDPNRIKTIGYGGKKPLPLKDGETEYKRSYQAKLSRIEVYLIQESY